LTDASPVSLLKSGNSWNATVAFCGGDSADMSLTFNDSTCLWTIRINCGGGGLPDGYAEADADEDSCVPFSLSANLDMTQIANNTDCCTAGGTMNVSITE